jgi:MFS transporter, DHA1 family, multidrug resistance protein
MYFTLPKGRAPDMDLSLKPRPIIQNFLSVIKNKQFATYAFTGSFAAAGLYAYIAGSPHVFMELYKVTEQQYGWIFAIIAMGLITASQVNSLMLRKYSSAQIIRIALIFQTLTAVIMCAGIILDALNVIGMIACIFCFLSCQGFTFPNSSALSLTPFSKNAGTASALMGAIQMATGTISSALVSLFSNNAALPMGVIMLLCSATALTILLTGRKILYRKASIELVKEEAIETIITS